MKARKNNHFLLSLLLLSLCLFLFSCEGTTKIPEHEGKSLQLHAQIKGNYNRATNATWDEDDIIGVYMVGAGTTLGASAISHNAKYITSGSSAFLPADETEEIIFPFGESTFDFISYYPYREEILDYTYPIDVSNQSAQAAIDLLYSDNAKGHSSSNPDVTMLFSHQLSKICLNIIHHSSFDIEKLSVIISNIDTKATFNLSTGTLSGATARTNTSMLVNTDESSAEAILLPSTDLSEVELWFIVGENEEVFKYKLKDALSINTFEKSTKYTYNVTMSANENIAIAKGTISNWIEGHSEDISVERTDQSPPLVKGSKKAPYSVLESQLLEGKTGVWVEGYIVGTVSGNINNFIPGNSSTVTSNIALSDTPDEIDVNNIIPVNLSESTASIRSALNIPDNPENINKKVLIKGDLDTYFSVPGMRNPKEYAFTLSDP